MSSPQQRFAVSPNGWDIAVQEHDADAWFFPERNMRGKWGTGSLPVGWRMYVPATEQDLLAAEVHRTADLVEEAVSNLAWLRERARTISVDDAAHLREQVREVERERDLAVAHDRQAYPTADAYERACAAREKHRQRADTAEALLAEYRAAIGRLLAVCAQADHGQALKAGLPQALGAISTGDVRGALGVVITSA